LGLGKGQLAGSYCVQKGTEFNETDLPTQNCEPSQQNCGEAFNRELVINSELLSVGVNPGSSCERSGTVCGDDTLCCNTANPYAVTASPCSDVGLSATIAGSGETRTVCP
jgi:hypothetical protein